MVAFPYYAPSDIDALNNQALALLKLFGARGYIREEPSVLQPADIFLDRSGEEIRRRTFTLTDPSGRDLCLRPDLTIPICKHVVDSGAKLPVRICYNGPVFRHQPAQPQRATQFFQAGAELLGLDDASGGEKEILGLACDALRVAGLKDFEMLFGDLALFGALVDALDLPAHWRARLKRHFWRAGYVETLLDRLGHAAGPVPTRAEIEARLDKNKDAPHAGRSRQDVIARVLEQAKEAAGLKLDPAVTGAIVKLFGIVSTPAEEALAQIRTLVRAAGLKLDAQLAAMDARLAMIASLGIARVRFTAHFGRNMEYYTGFVFELWSRDALGRVQIAGGGRYDTLLRTLGAPRDVSAIGLAIRTERLLAARNFQDGTV